MLGAGFYAPCLRVRALPPCRPAALPPCLRVRHVETLLAARAAARPLQDMLATVMPPHHLIGCLQCWTGKLRGCWRR